MPTHYTGWLKKSKLLSQYNSLLFWATLYKLEVKQRLQVSYDHSRHTAVNSGEAPL